MLGMLHRMLVAVFGQMVPRSNNYAGGPGCRVLTNVAYIMHLAKKIVSRHVFPRSDTYGKSHTGTRLLHSDKYGKKRIGCFVFAFFVLLTILNFTCLDKCGKTGAGPWLSRSDKCGQMRISRICLALQ